MARRPSDRPWFRSDRNSWFITINGRQHNLGPDKAEAEIKLLQLKLDAKQTPPPASSPVADVTLVLDVIDEFLAWCCKHREPRTHQFYQEKTQSFIDYLKAQDMPYLPAADLRPFHLQKWADSHDSWADGQKRQAIMSVQRAFNWAVKNGRIDRSTVQQVEKPPAGKRELVITFTDHQGMLDGTRCEQIRDLLNTCWEIGCRPQEVMRVEARHVDLDRRRWVFAKKEAKGKKRIRIVYLSDVAFDITKRLVEKHPEGRLFRNSDGVPWTRHAINCVMLRLAKKTGKKFALVDYRHSFVTRALKNGVDPITLANLLGHADPTMIARVYSHLSQDSEHLMKALGKTNGD